MKIKMGLAALLMILICLTSAEDTQGLCKHKYAETPMATILYDRMFPVNIIKNQDISKPQIIPGTPCYFIYKKKAYVINGNSNVFPINWGSQKIESEGLCDTIPGKPEGLGEVEDVTVSNTHITTIERDAFNTWNSTKTLKISSNRELQQIMPGAFTGLVNVWKLEINDNSKLSDLHEKSLSGLTQLRGLFLLSNNISNIAQISRALSTNELPNLVHLDLTGNRILTVGENDFLPMQGGILYTLIMSLTKTEYIHPKALDPFGDSIVSIGLSEINVNESVLTALMERTTEFNQNLQFISLEENLLCKFPSKILNLISNTAVGLSLSNNHFGLISPGTLPVMHKLKFLDLTDNMIDEIPDGVINSTILPKLEHLYLGRNMISELTSSMITPTVTRLVIKNRVVSIALEDSNYAFHLPGSVFQNVPNLQLLDLTGNTLNILNKETLEFTHELRVLLLSGTSLNEITPRSFENNGKLYYLDLSKNSFPMINSFTPDIFYGLEQLLALDLSNCHIDTLKADIFKYVPNLQYLSLRENPISKFHPSPFTSVPRLKYLDVRYNIIVFWNDPLFTEEHCLKKFLLNYNNINGITEAMLKDFKKIEEVDLYANSITCDCNLFLNIQNAKIDKMNLSFIEETKCSYLSSDISLEIYLAGLSSYSCVSYKKAIISCSIMLVIIVLFALMVLYYKFKYDVQYRFLLLKKKLGLVNHYRTKKKCDDGGDYMYDAFVSYSACDSSFVEKMMLILERDGSKFKLCVFERDFQAGDNLVDKILECMEGSMVTILVLTEAFASSEWCRWEMSIAQNRIISQHFLRDSLILIMKSPIDESLMTPSLRYLVETRIYLEWHEHSSVRQNIFWEKLKDALKDRTKQLKPKPVSSTKAVRRIVSSNNSVV